MRPYTLGIDLHKRSSVWVLLDVEGNEVWKDSVPCDPDHITKTIKWMPAPGTDVQAALEPTCGWRWVAALLEEAGVEVHPANVNKVRLIAESTQKHDLGDARALANLLRLGYLPESYRVPDSVYGLRVALRHRSYLVRLRVSAKNRLHGMATIIGLHRIARKNPLSKAGKAGIMAGDDVAMKELHTLIEELDRRIAECDARCEKIAKGEPLVPILRSMPGIGIVTALTVIAEVGDFTRFASAKHISSFSGLIPRQRSSGESIRFGSITNQGSRILRTAMVEAAFRIRPTNAPELYAFLARLAPVCGKKRARIALARKMFCILWHMAKTKTPYDKGKIVVLSPRIANVSHIDTYRGALTP
jgi:transposase